MYQGTTPSIPLKFKGADISSAKIYLTIFDKSKQKKTTFESGVDFSVEYDGKDTVGTILLTQEQTLDFTPGEHAAQARFIFPDGSAGVTKEAKVEVKEVIQKGVIEYA